MSADVDAILDLLDLSFNVIDGFVREHIDSGVAEDAINELNHRFREHTIGYECIGGKVVRVDSQYIHSEVVKTTIALLHDAMFQGASDEFLRAHEHYRHTRTKETIADALKAFESTLKTICDLRGWSYPPGATAKPLIDIVLKNGLLPPYMESHLAGLRITLETGLPTVRNKTSGHGQGREPVTVPEHVAAYALHLAATNIVFLVESHKAMP